MTDKKPDHNNDFRPERLDVAGLALVNGRLQASDLLQKYQRLMQETSGNVSDRAELGAQIKVEWQAQGDQGDHVEGSGAVPQVWLHLQAKTHLPQVCQRCLADVDLALEVDRSYRFVADEATAEAQDDESEEDVLALSREFNLMELIEDELLMALPLVPRHDVCPVQPRMTVSDDDFESASGDKPNPFAVLGALKVKKSD